MKLLGALALIAFLCACEKAPHDVLAAARRDLTEGDYAEAIAAADEGLRRAKGGAISWGLELVKLEAHARAGHGAEAKAQLEKLARLHPDRIPATEYSATAHQLQQAGQGPAAIEVLDLGLKLHPGDELIGRMIGASASAGSDPAELEMLRSLGYIE
jgi:tetratricopeptide (TPR) repeat protein